jgi:hypothetical protein
MPALWQAYFEHCEGLATSEEDHFRPFKLLPVESGSASTAGDEEPVHLIDLSKMNCRCRLARGQGCEGLAWSGLDDVGAAFFHALTAETPGGETVHSASKPSAFRKPPAITEMSGEQKAENSVNSILMRSIQGASLVKPSL